MDTKSVIEKVYALFNARDVDGVLAFMTEDVSWPKASEGGKVVGTDEIRAYWKRQWSEFDPLVEPVEIVVEGEKVHVRVHQVVRSLQGELLADSEVLHVFTMRDELIAAMDLEEEGISAAFAHR